MLNFYYHCVSLNCGLGGVAGLLWWRRPAFKDEVLVFTLNTISSRAWNEGYPKVPEDFAITEKVPTRKIMMGEGNRVASVILLTFTLKPGPHAHSLCEAQPPC